MAAKKVIQAGHPNLKKRNLAVKNINSPKIKQLIKDLKSTMYKSGLIGIAANQIAQNYQIFVTHPRTTKSRKLGKSDNFRVYINPQIVFLSKSKNLIYEGCGSIDGGASIFGPVIRPSEIEIEATNEHGKKFRLIANGILARVIQHEIDHLNGIEFIEKVSDYSKIITQKYYRKNIRKSEEQIKNSVISKIEYKEI